MTRKQLFFTVIALATMNTPAAIFSAFFESTTDLNKALLTAAKTANNQKVYELLEAGADVNYINNDQKTLSVERDRNTALIKAAHHGHITTIEILLNAGANVHYINRDGETALTAAAIEGHAAIVKKLLDAGANANHADPYGTTALLWAAFKGHKSTVKNLINAGADFNHIYNGSITALIEAIKNGHTHTAKILLYAGANPLSSSEIRSLAYGQKKIRPEVIQHIQHKTNYERNQALGQWCNYINTTYSVPFDIQRLIIRDILGTVPEQIPF